MKTKAILVALLTVVAAACGQQAPAERRVSRTTSNTTQPRAAHVPAFQDAQSAKSLRPTLPLSSTLGS